MRALLDTHTLLWWLSDDPALSRPARKIIADIKNTLVVSAASAWEIATKVRLGKLPTAASLAADFAGYVEREGFQMLPDPFDRMLIAQSQADNLPILSNETVFDSYGIRRMW